MSGDTVALLDVNQTDVLDEFEEYGDALEMNDSMLHLHLGFDRREGVLCRTCTADAVFVFTAWLLRAPSWPLHSGCYRISGDAQAAAVTALTPNALADAEFTLQAKICRCTPTFWSLTATAQTGGRPLSSPQSQTRPSPRQASTCCTPPLAAPIREWLHLERGSEEYECLKRSRGEVLMDFVRQV